MTDYKQAQQEARDAARRARNGPIIVCRVCMVGGEGGPLLKVKKGEYRHKKCM